MLTVYIALTVVWNGSPTAIAVGTAAGFSSVVLMAMIDLQLRSDFRCPLLDLAPFWAVAVLLAAAGM